MLYVDEAHAIGVRGQQGLGCAEQYGVIDAIDFSGWDVWQSRCFSWGDI